MKKRFLRSFVITSTVVATAFLSTMTAWADASSYSGQYIGPGTYYSSRQTTTGSGAQTIKSIESVVGTPNIKFEGADSTGAIKSMNVLKQANQKNVSSGGKVIGAVNGDFFDMTTIKGLTYGTSIVGGEIRTAVPSYSVFGVDSQNKPFIQKLVMTGRIRVTGGGEYGIDAINRTRWGNQIVVYTSAFGATTRTTSGTEIVLKDCELPLAPNKPLVGKVASVSVGTGGTTIPSDGIVISVDGAHISANIMAQIEEGTEVTVSADFNAPDIVDAIGGDPRLLENGMLSPEINTHVTALSRNPRTAIGLKGDRVVMVAVDGRKSNAKGMTLPEFANYLRTLGITDAINFDGGGSTTMVARTQYNSVGLVVNTPSDGGLRSVGNSLQIVSYAPLGNATYLNVKDSNVKVFVGSTFTPSIQVMDQYYNLLPNTNGVTFTADGVYGTLTDNGGYLAKAPGTGSMTMKAGLSVRTLPITVVDAVSKLKLNETSTSVKVGGTKQFNVSALDGNLKKVYINNNSVKWKTEGNIGTVDGNGMFTATNVGSGKVVAYLNDWVKVEANVTVTADVPVAPTPTAPSPETPSTGTTSATGPTGQTTPMESFDILDNVTITTLRTEATSSLTMVPDQKKEGAGALKIDYTMDPQVDGTSAVYIKFNNPLEIPENAAAIGLWVYGDGGSNWLRAYATTASGEQKTLDFTAIREFNWSGWQYVTVKIPKNGDRLTKLEQIYFAQPQNELKKAGTVIFDDLSILYE